MATGARATGEGSPKDQPVARGTSGRGGGWPRDQRELAIVGVGLCLIVLPNVILSGTPFRLHPSITPLVRVEGACIDLVWIATAVLLSRRQPGSRLWLLILATVASGQVYTLGYVPNSAVFMTGQVLSETAAAVFVHLVLAFPSGHLRDRVDRVLVPVGYAYAIGIKIVILVFADRVWYCQPGPCLVDYLSIWPRADLVGSVTTLGQYSVPVILALVLLELARHWRRSSPAARRALAPVVASGLVSSVVFSAGYLSDALGIGWLQELTHGTISALGALVLPLGLLLAALRLQLARGRIAGLALQLAQGTPLGGLRDVLARSLADPTLELAFAAPSGSGFVDPSGRAFELPAADGARAVTRLERDGQLLGVLVHDRAAIEEDPTLVHAISSVARLALENERLAAEVRAQLEEVRASRARIVEAGDVERRKVERDLHDGAQQRLVALTMRLEQARGQNAGSGELIDAVGAELRATISEVRDLSRGLHPAILTEAGLAAAVESLAERTSLPVEIDVPAERFAENVEATAYFVVAEALTNVARYAEATHARVSAQLAEQRLVLEVIDDGRGGADPARGSGLRGLADRVAAAGGTLALTSPAGGGTRLRAEIPLP